MVLRLKAWESSSLPDLSSPLLFFKLIYAVNSKPPAIILVGGFCFPSKGISGILAKYYKRGVRAMQDHLFKVYAVLGNTSFFPIKAKYAK